MKEVYVADAVRTPIGNYGGILSSIRPDDMLAHVIRSLLDRNPGLDPAAIEDIIAGDANQAGEDNRNVARMGALLAGLPVTVPGSTVNRLCASGLQAIMDGSRTIMCGHGEVILACGVESMTRAPFILPKSPSAFNRQNVLADSTIGWRFPNPKLTSLYYPYNMGETAENVARQWGILREDQDLFAMESHQKYFFAREKGNWEKEIVPIAITMNQEEQVIASEDEHPRRTSLSKLSALKAAFVKGGTVTAGNSSGINDGAAAILLVSESALNRFGLSPLARIRSMGVTGVDPSIMGIGPVSATLKIMSRDGNQIHNLDLVELNEAFASQSLACIRDLKLDPSIVNVNGGAIALGHPLGCSGTRISVTLIHEMKRRKSRLGLATMCIGVGQGAAILYEGIT